MKKIISLFLAGVMMLAMVSCSESKKEDSKDDVSAESPLALLNTVWDSYSDDEKFPVAGGDYTEENQNPEGPGKYSLDDPNAVENALGMPIESVSKLEDAASIMHMMNANTFTCSVLRAKKSDDVSTLAKDMKEVFFTSVSGCAEYLTRLFSTQLARTLSLLLEKKRLLILSKQNSQKLSLMQNSFQRIILLNNIGVIIAIPR